MIRRRTDEAQELLCNASSMADLSAMVITWALDLPRALEAKERHLVEFAVEHTGELVNRALDLIQGS